VTWQPGVLINANARGARRDPGLADRLRRLVPADCVQITRSAKDVVPAFSALMERGIDALVLVGGDGTLAGTLTPLLLRFDAAALPAVVPTLGGTVNTVSHSLGARGEPEGTVAALRKGELREHRRAVLRAVADGGQAQFGFLFVNGVGVRFLELYYQSALGPRGAISVVSRITASALVGGSLARHTFAPFAAELDVDGDCVDARHFTVIAAGAVRHLGLGFAPLYSAGSDPERIHLAATGASAARIALELPALRLGARGRDLSHFACRRAELRTAEPLAWSLDAELLPPARRLELAAGPVLRFLCPSARSA
jgi:diacylglycerol kinase family enzyme